MEYITSGIQSICFGSNATKANKLKLTVKLNDQVYEYQGYSNDQTMKLYYNMLAQANNIKYYNDFKTIIELEGIDKQTYLFSTYKKIF